MSDTPEKHNDSNKKIKLDIDEGILFGMGNPLLDILANTEETFLEKYELEPNNAILAEDKHQSMYQEMSDMKNVEYIAGGATQNSMRVAQWIIRQPKRATFMGSVGEDAFSKILQSKAEEAGVVVRYQKQSNHPTGTCAVVVTNNGKCRSLVANLAAANHFTVSHLEIPENQALMEKAQFYYISGFFLTVSPESILKVGKHACEKNKLFCMNLSAPFLCEFFKEPMMKAFPFVDLIFGNETEAAKFAEIQGFDTTDIKEIALKTANLPKHNGNRQRTVVYTQGAENVILAKDGKITEFPVTKLSEDELIDTNGAGDAFVGGFLAQLVQGKSTEDCIKCGIWAATQIIQRSGCSFSKDVKYPD